MSSEVNPNQAGKAEEFSAYQALNQTAAAVKALNDVFGTLRKQLTSNLSEQDQVRLIQALGKEKQSVANVSDNNTIRANSR